MDNAWRIIYLNSDAAIHLISARPGQTQTLCQLTLPDEAAHASFAVQHVLPDADIAQSVHNRVSCPRCLVMWHDLYELPPA